jgi:hypothetical protein
MKNKQQFFDRTAIALSTACVIHCLAFPIIAVALPSLIALNLSDESLHLWLLFAVVPVSIFALAQGCDKHKSYRALLAGFTGLAILLAAYGLGHDLLGESGEKLLTIIGGCLIAAAHIKNQRLCREHDCACHS